MASISTDRDAERQGIDRRTLIRRAAIAGTVAWTAPVIIGSLTSPAAAFTGPTGCNSKCFTGGNCNPDSTSLCNAPAGCSTTSNPALDVCLQATPTPPSKKCDGSNSITISVVGGCTGCKIVGYTYNVPGAGCQVVLVDPPLTSVFIPAIADHANQTCVSVQCGD
jgi:hypothetical protein